MEIRRTELIAAAVAEPADVADGGSFEAAVEAFDARNYTYMPLPEDGEYYHVDDGWVGELRDRQVVAPDADLPTVLELLVDNPFLLVDYGPEGDRVEYPGRDGDRSGRYGIVTVSDLNKRPVHELVYPVIAELASLLARRIEARYDSRELFDHLHDRTVGAWVKDAREDVELHVAESMDLGEMERVLRASDPDLAKSCGFRSKDELDDVDRIRELRNRVMHANRSLVRTGGDVADLIATVERAEELIERANSGAAFP